MTNSRHILPRDIYDFSLGSGPGPMVRLETPDGHQVVLLEWPQSLFDMLRAGVLGGAALREAESLIDATRSKC